MDTRQLRTGKPSNIHKQAQVYDEQAGNTVAVTYDDEGHGDEISKRWNAYLPLISAIDAMCTELEESGMCLDETRKHARNLITAQGFDEDALGRLADYNEETNN